MAPPLLILRDINLTFGGTPLFEGAELTVSAGERVCLVGRNGSGKSTLLKIAAEIVEPDQGEIFLQPGTTMRYLPQEPNLSGFQTSLSYVEDGLSSGDDPYRAQYLLEQLSLTGREDPSTLSGGEIRRCAIARALAPEPDILFLDEPTNHLDLPSIEWLEAELHSMNSALVLISHDRHFLEKLSETTVWLSQGSTRRLNQNFSKFENWRDTTLEQEEIDRHKLDRKLAAETEWLRKGVTARRKRNQGRLRALLALRKERKEQRGPTGQVNFTTNEGNRSGKLVLEAKSISKSFGNGPIVKGFSTRIQRGDRVGIVGPNGAGKTTLLNILTGVLSPDEGNVRLGANLEIVSLDQKREMLDAESTLANALTGGGEIVSVGGQNKHVIGYMKDFLFSPEQAKTPVGVLSGGERGRLMLARALARPSNLLILDEPTNDLDLETLDLLQEMISDYPGTIILVSHDRDFLDRTVTSIICAEGNGEWIEYAGGYRDLVAQRGTGVVGNGTLKKPKALRKEKNSTKEPSPSSKGKLSYKDKHALETLPKRMDELQSMIDKQEAILADPSLFSSDPQTFEEAAQTLKSAQDNLAIAEEQWLELEMLREKIEGS
ncbi:MAG: elongation factor 3 [Rhodospirillaceae bacterium]|nr:elongation factor 3 [Rhodospirillaceae bacterium]|tara:strand:- start:6745 stop:8556 length:1812 start_codon:yes stop_codon:yes gene_type:complete